MKKIVPQAERSKAEATSNINRKIEVLRAWATNGIPFLVGKDGLQLLDSKDNKLLDYFPTSLRSFKEWNGTQNSLATQEVLPKIGRVGNDTLAIRPELEKEVIELLKALKLRAELQISAGKYSEIKRLTKEKQALTALLSIRRAEFRTLRVAMNSIENENQRITRKAEIEANEFDRVLASKNAEIERLKLENAELIASSKKVRSLRSVDKNDKQPEQG